MQIDALTIMVMIMIANLLTGGFILAYIFKKQDLQSKTVFILAKLLQSLGWLFVILRGSIPDWVSIIGANWMMIAAVMLESWSLMQLHDKFDRLIRLLHFIFTGAALVAITIIYLWANTLSNRIFVFSFAVGVLLLGPSYVFLTRKNRSVLELMYAITNMTAFVFFMIRAINAYAHFYDTEILSNHWFNSFTYIMLFAYMTVTNVGFILLSKERTDVVLLQAATIDSLTRIYNRQTFLEKSFACIDKAKEAKQPVSLLMFDIDNFKWVNDTYGHMAGDAVLREIAVLVSQGLAGCETIGRFGGDEFAILMPGSDEEKSAARADMMERVVKNHSFTQHGLKLRISIGVVTIVPEGHVNFDTFYRLADLGLYDAKNTGKGTWRRAHYLPEAER